MPRLIEPDESIEAMRDEINFTGARLEDEPLAAVFGDRTAEWHVRLEAIEKAQRAIEREEVAIDAARAGGNLVLDAACSDFGDELLPLVNKDRTAPRWRAFFRSTISDFIRQPLNEQVVAVRAWLTDSQDEVLLAHKPVLEIVTARVERAIEREVALGVRRGTFWQEREAFATWLTLQRDVLHNELAVLTRANRLPRIWADSFFRAGKGAPRKKAAPPQPAQPPEPSQPPEPPQTSTATTPE